MNCWLKPCGILRKDKLCPHSCTDVTLDALPWSARLLSQCQPTAEIVENMGTRATQASEREGRFLTALRSLTPYTMPESKFSESGHAAEFSSCILSKASDRHLLASTLQQMQWRTHSMVEFWNDKHASLSPDSMSWPFKLCMALAAS